MQKKSDQILCPKCKRIPWKTIITGEAFNTHICFQDCGNVYWTLNICPKCDHPQKTLFIKKPNFSQLIVCANCDSKMYYFRCPKQSCKQLFYKDYNAYLMGLPLFCETCKFAYKTLACQCGGQVKLLVEQNIIEGYSAYKCDCCSKDIIYTICTQCFKPDYHVDKLQIGDKIRCSHCKKRRTYVPCPCCGRSTNGQKFNFCLPTKCNYCSVVFQYSNCPYGCGINYHLGEKPVGPIRICKGACQQQYFVINCTKCEIPVYLDGLEPKFARREKCPSCSTELKFYYCSCGYFNPVGTTCINSKCPPPKDILSYTYKKKEEKGEKPSEKNKSNETFVEDGCKICFDAKSTMINLKCRHLMMCDDCYKQIKSKRPNGSLAQLGAFSPGDNHPCPVCKTIGQYIKYVSPIYS